MRNDEKIAYSFEMLDDGRWKTKTGCKIVFPTKYRQKSLASFGEYINVLSVFEVMLPDGTTGVQRNICQIRLAKCPYKIEKINDEDMYVFNYEAGDIVIDNDEVIVDKMLSYYVYEYFIDKGYVPYFLEYEDMLMMWENVEYTTGLPVGAIKEIMRAIVASIARHPNDPKIFYRQAINRGYKGKPKWIAFSSVIHGPRTTTAKLMGNHFQPALIAALLTDNAKPEILEDILRRS